MSATTPESRVKKAIKAVLIEFGCWFFMPVSNGMGRMGVPDFIVCYRGVLIAIEAKAPGKIKDTTVLQERNIEAIQKAGGVAIVVDNAETVREVLRDMEAAH